MIQRVQSIYLLIIALISILILFLNPKYASFTKADSNKTTQLGFTTTTLADEAGEQNVSKWINSLMLSHLIEFLLIVIFHIIFAKFEISQIDINPLCSNSCSFRNLASRSGHRTDQAGY